MSKYIADTIDFKEMTTAGKVRGFVLRATIGLANDTTYSQWLPQVQEYTSHGSYHFLYPDVNHAAQAKNFVDTRTPGRLGDWLDVETSELGIPTWPMVRDFVDQYFYLTRENIGIYTNVGTWEGEIKWYDPAFADLHPLWVANWDIAAPLIPRPWTSYKLWQYAAVSGLPGYTYVPGQNSKSVDVNVVG